MEETSKGQVTKALYTPLLRISSSRHEIILIRERLDVLPAPSPPLPFKCKWFSHKPQCTEHLKSSCAEHQHKVIVQNCLLLPLNLFFFLSFPASQIPKSILRFHVAACGRVFSCHLGVPFMHHGLTPNSVVRCFYRPQAHVTMALYQQTICIAIHFNQSLSHACLQ